ncbi:MAG: ATP-binding protein [Salinisphaeraceae bacterium]|nr:ATP-binding protein [Salinisphaeraceae bacterium]
MTERDNQLLLQQLAGLLKPAATEPDWSATAYRWRNGQLEGIAHPQAIALDDLLGIDRQKAELNRNTRQFLAGLPANNALLWGARGTGKSSVTKALLNEYAEQGLRIIEVDRHDLVDLPDIVAPLFGRAEKYLLYCDDLSFEADDPGYKALKAALDGSLAAPPDNVLIYATSNRRHLLPEYNEENQQAQLMGGEIHHGEAVEEKISLSDRFGLWLAFHPFSQDQYLAIVEHHVERLAKLSMDETMRKAALQWALSRGSRSGRVAWQFARDWAGRQQL